MRAPQRQVLFTVDEYLKLERAAKERHEYLDGRIHAMAGESDAHGDISVNLVLALGNQLRGKPCRIKTKDTKLRSGPTPTLRESTAGLYSYPDLIVVCGEKEFHDTYKDVIINPTMIVEVLSPSTESFDRGLKFQRYRKWNPTLRDYLLVSQDQPLIDHFYRNAEGAWFFEPHEGLDAVVVITSIDCKLKLADVYERVEFVEDKSETES